MKPQAFLFEYIHFVDRLHFFPETFDFILFAYAVPHTFSRTVIEISCSDTEIFLVTSSPVTFDFEINLWVCDTEYSDPSKSKKVTFGIAKELWWDLF